MIDTIVKINSLGWATFPLSYKDKIPVVSGWKNRKADILTVYAEEKLYTMNDAYGIVLRPQDLVIDIDPRNFKDNINPWKKLKTDLGLSSVAPPAVLTGGGGAHLYFRKPEDIDIVLKLKEYPGLDFKSGGRNKGAYVVGPGSNHASGKRYTLREGSDLANIPDIPPAILDLIIKTAHRRAEEGTGAFTGGEQEYTRYVTWLTHTAIPEMAKNGNDAQRYRIACVGRDYGLKPKDTIKAILTHYNPACTPVWGEEKVAVCVENAYKYADGTPGSKDPVIVFDEATGPAEEWDAEGETARRWDIDNGNNTKKTMRNAVNFLYTLDELKHTVKYNQFTGDLEIVGKLPWADKRGNNKNWLDQDVILLKYYLHKTTRVEFNVAILWEALYTAGTRHAYHPIRDYIKNIQWDKKERLATWLHDYCHTEQNTYIAAVGAKTIIAAIARVFVPGFKFDHCLVLEGDQGIGKSSVCAVLGGEWYGDFILDPHSRDTIDAMRGKWFIEMSEMEVTKRADVQALKAFISRTSDRTRLAYARASCDFPRQCVFIGTINPDDLGYLSDRTGNRRFWPVKCEGHIDLEGLKNVREQLLAEAYVRFKQGEKLYLTGDDEKFAGIEQNKRVYVDAWKDVLADWMAGQGANVDQISTIQVWELVLGGTVRAMTRSDQTRIGYILKDLGWHAFRPLRGGSRQRMYQRDLRGMEKLQ